MKKIGIVKKCLGCGNLLEKNLWGKTEVCSEKCLNSRRYGLSGLGVNDDL